MKDRSPLPVPAPSLPIQHARTRQMFPRVLSRATVRAWPGMLAGPIVLACLLAWAAEARADLLIELDAADTQAQRILVQPPRIRLEMHDSAYQLYDAGMDAMVTVRPAHGVFHEEDPAALAAAARRFSGTLQEHRAALDSRIAGTLPQEQSQWADMLEQWDGNAPAPVSGDQIESIVPDQDPESAVAGIACRSMRITLVDSDDRMLVCVAAPDSLNATETERKTLAALFRYLERLRRAARAPGKPPLSMAPGLIAEVMERTGMFVLAAARWNDEATLVWKVADLWPGRLDEGQFVVPEELREIDPPYGD